MLHHQQPHLPQGRSQSFRHRGGRGTVTTANATTDSSVERRRSTPTITRRCSLQSRARVEPRIDAWPEPKHMSEVEERFLQLPDSGDYTRVRQFNIDAKGAVIARGDSFRRKRQAAQAQHSNPLTPLTGGGTELNGNDRSSSAAPLLQQPHNVSEQQQDVSRSASSVSSGCGGKPNGTVTGQTETAPDPASTSAYKICVMGQAGAGKSALIRQFISSEYRNAFADEIPEDAADAAQNPSVSINIGGHECDLTFTECDLQGDSDRWTMDQQRDFHAYLLVYCIDRKASFRVALRALGQLRDEHCPAPVILVGNKMDLERKRAVMEHEVKSVMFTFDVPHFQVSVALNHDIDDLLIGIIAQIKESFRMKTNAVEKEKVRTASRSSKGSNGAGGADSDFQAAIRRFSRRKKRQMGMGDGRGAEGAKCANLFDKLCRWRKGTF